MELRHLQALTAISDHGTFSAAAEHLNTVQSNISAHVARLERELGAPLVDRADGSLTEEGAVVVARARRILSELDALVADVAACKDEVTGTVRVGMIGTTARWLVPRLMDMARQRHPKLRLVVVEGIGTGLEPQLASGQLDLAVLNLPLSGRDLVARQLFEEDLMLMVPEGHAMADPKHPLGLADLAEMELLLPLPGTAFRDELDAVTRPLGITLLPAAEIDGLRLIASLTFEGYGPAILPATAIPSYLRSQFHPVPVGRTTPAPGGRGPTEPGPTLRTDPGPGRAAAGRGGHPRRPAQWRARERLSTSVPCGGRQCGPRSQNRGVRTGESEPGWPRFPPHPPHRGVAGMGAQLVYHLEAEPGVERDVPLLGRLEVGRDPVLVGPVQHRLQQGGAHAASLVLGRGAQRGQVPVGLLRMEPVHLEQQPQGPQRARADEERCRRE